jgi:hypothetical protein
MRFNLDQQHDLHTSAGVKAHLGDTCHVESLCQRTARTMTLSGNLGLDIPLNRLHPADGV